MWKTAHDTVTSGAKSSEEDLRYQDLCQENAILKEELADLYSHLMIIDDSNEVKENSKVSSVGRLIIYDKNKRDTETLLVQELQRQKIAVLEKELAFQLSHMKELATKTKEFDTQLQDQRQRCVQLSADTVALNNLKLKLKDLSIKLEEKESLVLGLTATNEKLQSNISNLQETKQHMEVQLNEAQHGVVSLKISLNDCDLKIRGLEHQIVELQLNEREYRDCAVEWEIAAKKSEVRAQSAESEARHWARKCESQRKDLLRLRETTEKQHQIILEMNRSRVDATDEADAALPLIATLPAATPRTDSARTGKDSEQQHRERRCHSDRAQSTQYSGRTHSHNEVQSPPHSYQMCSTELPDHGDSPYTEDCMCSFFPVRA